MKKDVWIIGPGNMGLEYYKVLSKMNVKISVIGRSEKKDWPTEVYSKGLNSFIKDTPSTPDYAIVCVNERNLYHTTLSLIKCGIKNILVEKPAGLDIEQIEKLYVLSKEINLYVGYNRRFYQSVQKCKQIIDNSTGPINITFEFTEWPHKIDFDHYTKKELSRFFMCNSSHVVDTVFHLAGYPRDLKAMTYGHLDWHPSAAIFSGCGVTNKNILFSYSANWLSAGRWGIDINTDKGKYILKPLEKLFFQKKGSLEKIEVNLDTIDTEYKCGLYKQTEAFLNNSNQLCTIKEHFNNCKYYFKIANYESGHGENI